MTVRLTSIVVLACSALATPAHAQSTTGGAAYTPDALTASPADTLLGATMAFSGSAPPGREVLLQRFDREHGWVAESTATADEHGRFTALWQPIHIGRFRMRAVVEPPGASAAKATSELAVTVYRPALATWYGPGFYGRRTACGKRMSRSLIGVAHKKLRCGTRVALLYKGRVLVAPVVDRGPYRKGTDWDLTYAAARTLGFTYTDTIGAVRLDRRR